jgi:glycosyltransferase involved in cell wall biosynthesis
VKIGYYIRNYVFKDRDGKVAMGGGVKVISQHVRMLKEAGYETFLLTRNVGTDLDFSEYNIYEKPTVAKSNTDIPDCDIYVGTVYSDVRMLYQMRKGKVIHLCQGYEPIDFESRIKGEAITEKYLRKGFFSIWRYVDVLKFKKRIREIESVYALPTVKAAVSKHLAELIQKRYHQKCFLIQNGIDPDLFHPDERRVWGKNGRIKILSVGSFDIGAKRIKDTLGAITILKEKGVSIEFTRVSQHPPSKEEGVGTLVDRYYINLTESEMAELYRNSDIFISSSLETEGFGLPAMEALASGVPSILTEISSYLNFDEKRDFAYFVPTHRPDRIAEGILTFIEDQRIREKCRTRGLDVSTRFTLERTKKDLLNFVESLIR